VIAKERAQELREADEHNIVRLTLHKDSDQARPPDAYRDAARLLAEWREQDILIREPLPCIYLIEQTFSLGGEVLTRRGLLCATLLQEPDSGNVFRHEKTTTGPKLDRYKLMEACKASLSPVFGIFGDQQGEVRTLMPRLRQGEPVAEFTTEQDIGYRVWRVTDRRHLETLGDILRDEALVIADGHHRYETAVVYRRKNRSADGPPGSVPEDFLLTFCVPATDPGLRIRPTHRLVKSPEGFSMDALASAVSRYFDTNEVKVASVEEIEQTIAGWQAGGRRFACFGAGGRLLEFSPREAETRGQDEEDSTRLPVNVLHRAIMPQILDLPEDAQDDRDRLVYEAEPETLYWDVESGRFDLAFLLPPLSPQTLDRLSRGGRLLPSKTTYFYPKIASGLAIYPFEGDFYLPELLPSQRDSAVL
jgi:uncharacterized protein (DUF1015 family)